jgi:hypothetical protein
MVPTASKIFCTQKVTGGQLHDHGHLHLISISTHFPQSSLFISLHMHISIVIFKIIQDYIYIYMLMYAGMALSETLKHESAVCIRHQKLYSKLYINEALSECVFCKCDASDLQMWKTCWGRVYIERLSLHCVYPYASAGRKLCKSISGRCYTGASLLLF